MTVEPHVSMKLKGLFSKIAKNEFGTLRLTATDENCRDLEWFMERYPMEVVGWSKVVEKARAYDARTDLTEKILSGQYEVPSYEMALAPRDYQRTAAALLWAQRGLLLGDELGLGKTVSALTVLSDPACLPALVVCPTHLPSQWVRECKRFLPKLKTHVLTKTTPYDIGKPDIVVMNYHKLSGWSETLAPYVKTVIYDECQELRRSDSYKYSAASHVSKSAAYRLGLSATPIYNYGGEFFNVMDAISPGMLGSREEFLREWCYSNYRDEDKSRIKEPQAFGTFLRESGRMLLRTKKEVGRELPAVSKVFHEIEVDTESLNQVESAATELANFIVNQKGDGFAMMRASQEFSNSLRQATGIAKAPYVATFVDMLLQDPTATVVLFGWHREVYSIWEERLAAHKPAWYTGAETTTTKELELNRFKNGATRLLIMSLRAGSGVDGLQKVCSRVVYGELDWSPGVHVQCTGRVHRDGQMEPVFEYYLVASEGSDPTVVDVLGLKSQQLEGVLDPHGVMIQKLQIDPDHVKKLALDYLKNKGTVSSKVTPGGKLDQILSSREKEPDPKPIETTRFRLKPGWKIR